MGTANVGTSEPGAVGEPGAKLASDEPVVIYSEISAGFEVYKVDICLEGD